MAFYSKGITGLPADVVTSSGRDVFDENIDKEEEKRRSKFTNAFDNAENVAMEAGSEEAGALPDLSKKVDINGINEAIDAFDNMKGLCSDEARFDTPLSSIVRGGYIATIAVGVVAGVAIGSGAVFGAAFGAGLLSGVTLPLIEKGLDAIGINMSVSEKELVDNNLDHLKDLRKDILNFREQERSTSQDTGNRAEHSVQNESRKPSSSINHSKFQP